MKRIISVLTVMAIMAAMFAAMAAPAIAALNCSRGDSTRVCSGGNRIGPGAPGGFGAHQTLDLSSEEYASSGGFGGRGGGEGYHCERESFSDPIECVDNVD